MLECWKAKMSLFSRNKQIVSDEYADALNKITKLNSDVALLKADVDAIKTGYNSVRGLINRKLGKYEEDEDEGEEKKEMSLADIQRKLMGLD